MTKRIFVVDRSIISVLKTVSTPISRISLFIVFFWFGVLKVAGLSPASPLIENLLGTALPFISFNHFLILFGLFEMAVGVLFLFPGFERVVLPLLFLHMLTTFMPLIVLPQITWERTFVPTLEGQYIIKNLVIIAVAIGIAADLHPLNERRK